MQKIGNENVDATMKRSAPCRRAAQAIATEMADYSKKCFEEGTAAIEKLFGAKSLDKAIEIQSDYVKAAYEGFVAQATKIGELYTDLRQGEPTSRSKASWRRPTAEVIRGSLLVSFECKKPGRLAGLLCFGQSPRLVRTYSRCAVARAASRSG